MFSDGAVLNSKNTHKAFVLNSNKDIGTSVKSPYAAEGETHRKSTVRKKSESREIISEEAAVDSSVVMVSPFKSGGESPGTLNPNPMATTFVKADNAPYLNLNPKSNVIIRC